MSLDITDDTPVATLDSNTVIEGATLTVSSAAGVLNNDEAGADSTGFAVAGVRVAGADTTTAIEGGLNTTIEGTYGDLVLQADGSYEYVADANTVPPQDAADVFVYTVEDADGDQSTTTLTINHSDSGLTATGGTIVSDDAALNDVTDTAAVSASGGTGTLSYALDGADSNGEVVLDEGKFTIDSVTGVVTFLQSAAYTHAEGSDLAEDVRTVTVVVTDADDNTTTADVSLDITDDTPSMGEVNSAISLRTVLNTNGHSISGQIPDFAGGADEFASLSVGLENDAFTYVTSTNPGTLEQTLTATYAESGTEAFVFTVDVNGNYTLTVTNAAPVLSITTPLLDNVVAGGPAGSYVASTDQGDILITGSGDVNPSSQGLGDGGNNNLDSGSEFLQFEFPNALTNSVTFGFNVVNSGNVELSYIADDNSEVSLGMQSVVKNGNETATFTIPNGVSADTFILEHDTGKSKVTFVSFDILQIPLDQQLKFLISGVDADGDAASTDINLYIDEPLDLVGMGTFVDGIVEGMTYVTSSGLTGRTDSNGRFNYQSGDTVTFSVGAIVLGSFVADEALADGKVFLQEIAGVGLEDMNSDYVENMAVLLQSLDNDGDAYNGIVINESIHEALSDDSFDLKTISKSDLAEVLQENGYTPVDEDDAMQHVRDMIEEHAGLTEFESRTDNVFATDGDDVFAFELSDEGQAGEDVTISGFGDSGSDALDLRDLLAGEEAEDADLTSYLNVSFDGANTVIEVSSSGGFAEGSAGAVSVDQTITLEGIDLVGSDELSTVIQNMLNNGQLITD